MENTQNPKGKDGKKDQDKKQNIQTMVESSGTLNPILGEFLEEQARITGDK